MDEKFFDKLKEKIKPFFDKGGSHAFDHTQRVYNLTIKISNSERDVDIDIVKAAALLHDIARAKQDRGEVVCHAEGGAEIAGMILREMNFPENKINNVLHAIKVHRHSKKLKAESIEAGILQDADRLDALGAITIARMFSTGGKMDRPIYDPDIPKRESTDGSYSKTTINGFYEKIFKIKPKTFNTKKAQKIAEKRYEFTKEFVKRLIKEWKGEL